MLPLAMLMLSVLAAFGASALLSRFPAGPRRTLVAVGLMGLVLFEDLPAWPERLAPALDPVYAELAREPGEAPIIDLTPDLSGLLAQTVHGRPIGFVPGISLRGAPGLEDFATERFFRQPRLALRLEGEQQRAEIDRLREEISIRGVELLLIPASPIAPRQIALARLVGGAIASRGSYTVADFSGVASISR